MADPRESTSPQSRERRNGTPTSQSRHEPPSVAAIGHCPYAPSLSRVGTRSRSRRTCGRRLSASGFGSHQGTLANRIRVGGPQSTAAGRRSRGRCRRLRWSPRAAARPATPQGPFASSTCEGWVVAGSQPATTFDPRDGRAVHSGWMWASRLRSSRRRCSSRIAHWPFHPASEHG